MIPEGQAGRLRTTGALWGRSRLTRWASGTTALALEGGSPIRTEPLAPWPCFDEDVIQAAVAVLRSGRVNYWTGDEGRLFEQEFASFAGCRHAVAVANGTVALEHAVRALGIGPGDEVIVPCRTFIASASAAVMAGATPVMADVDPVSQDITAETILPALSPRTKAIVAVHFAGWPCAMEPILGLARERGLRVIEDCAQAHGARYRGRPVGSLGDLAAFSFCQDKTITTGGEGGMVTTNHAEWWQRVWSFRDHGKSHDAACCGDHPAGYRWLHESFGTNGRMTEMQAAMGRVLLRKLPAWVEIRRQHAARLDRCLAQLPALRVTVPPEEAHHSYYKYHVFVRPERLRSGWDRDAIIAAIRAEGIPCREIGGGGPDISREKAFEGHPKPSAPLPNARALGETSLCFLVHPTLSAADIDDVCRAVEKVMGAATLNR